jgi:peptidoglycan L-alanyl-D-glutamate endopeptidase CwlK
LAQRLIDEAEKINLKVLITSTLRDAEYQLYLYSLGRTKAGQIVTKSKLPSAHGFGLAFDVCQNIKGREWEDPFFQKVSKIAVGLGLEWGGNWKSICDKPHFQFVGGLTNEQLRAGMLPMFPAIPTTEIKPEPPIFNDLNTVSPWALDAITKLHKLQILQGDDKGNVNPKKPINIQEMAVVINRLLKYLGK